ncbi:hypothetical protein ABIF02_005743 [Bradyrhizobium elkanii]
MLGQAKVLRRLRRAGRDDVPARPAAAEVIERCEQAGQVVGLGIGRRRGRDQADPFRGDGDCGQPGDRLEPEALCVANIVGERGAVGEKDRVELLGLGALRQLLIVGNVKDAICRRAVVAAMPPRDGRRDR